MTKLIKHIKDNLHNQEHTPSWELTEDLSILKVFPFIFLLNV